MKSLSPQEKSQLDSLLGALNSATGPIVIVARPHSGTRILAKALELNGVFMGTNISEPFLDNEDWYFRFSFPLITSRFFPIWSQYRSNPDFREKVDAHLAQTLSHFFQGYNWSTSNFTWGWKLSESIFLIPVIKQLFPSAKFIHVIRDGKDVVLSDDGYFQLTKYPINGDWKGFWKEKLLKIVGLDLVNFYGAKYKKFCLNITFNDCRLKEWRGIDLYERRELINNRFSIQMKSWLNFIETGFQHSKAIIGSYYEVRYEHLCEDPIGEVTKTLDFLNLEFRPEAAHFLQAQLHRRRINKWQDRNFTPKEFQDYRQALELGQPLLQKLGYTQEI